MTSAALFPSLLGKDFEHLAPRLQQVHGGGSVRLSGTVTVARGASVVVKALAAFFSLPPATTNAPIKVTIGAGGDGERWIRVFSAGHRLASTLDQRGPLLAERLGPAVLRFRVMVHGGAMHWTLTQMSVLKIPLPSNWFRISAIITAQDDRYHFVVDSAIPGIGRVIRYEGSLDAAA